MVRPGREKHVVLWCLCVLRPGDRFVHSVPVQVVRPSYSMIAFGPYYIDATRCHPSSDAQRTVDHSCVSPSVLNIYTHAHTPTPANMCSCRTAGAVPNLLLTVVSCHRLLLDRRLAVTDVTKLQLEHARARALARHSEPYVSNDMVFQGTVLGPMLWTCSAPSKTI